MTRGTRISHRIDSCVGSSGEVTPGIPSFSPSDRSTSPTPMSTGPATTPTANATARNDSAANAHPGVTPRIRSARADAAAASIEPYWRPRRSSAVPIARTRLTSRGPQRDAIESSSRTTEPERTAAIRDHPGRDATVRALCAQHTVSASTIRSGFAEIDVLGRELRVIGPALRRVGDVAQAEHLVDPADERVGREAEERRIELVVHGAAGRLRPRLRHDRADPLLHARHEPIRLGGVTGDLPELPDLLIRALAASRPRPGGQPGSRACRAPRRGPSGRTR